MWSLTEDDIKNLKALLGLLGISTLAAAARTILSEKDRTFIGFMRGIVLAVFVGVIVYMIMQSTEYSAWIKGATVSICAFCADYLLLMILSGARMIRDRPIEILVNIFLGGGGSGGGKGKKGK